MVKQKNHAENSSAKKKKLKQKQAPSLEDEKEEEKTPPKKIKELKKQPESSHGKEEESSAKKKRRIVQSVEGRSSIKKSKRLKENSFERKLAQSQEEEQQDLEEKKIKRKKRQTQNQVGTVLGQEVHAELEPQSENGIRDKRTPFSERKLALNKEEEKQEVEAKKIKRKRRQTQNQDGAVPGQGTQAKAELQSENGVHDERRAKTVNVSFRLLVPSQDMGRIIGKQGSRIQQLREETGAHIKIGDAIMNLEERVIWVASKEDTLTSQSAAERALLSVAAFLIEPENEDQEFAKIRLLIASSQANMVIGNKGTTLDKIREETGADVDVFNKDKFPLLAFASDTDKLLQLVGRTSQVQEALELVMASLRNKSPRHSQDARRAEAAAKGGAFETTTQIRIPDGLIGKLIGKEGSTIWQIRQQCGASIEVDKNIEDGAQKRIVHLKGMLSQVTMAQTLLQVVLASKQRAG